MTNGDCLFDAFLKQIPRKTLQEQNVTTGAFRRQLILHAYQNLPTLLEKQGNNHSLLVQHCLDEKISVEGYLEDMSNDHVHGDEGVFILVEFMTGCNITIMRAEGNTTWGVERFNNHREGRVGNLHFIIVQTRTRDHFLATRPYNQDINAFLNIPLGAHPQSPITQMSADHSNFYVKCGEEIKYHLTMINILTDAQTRCVGCSPEELQTLVKAVRFPARAKSSRTRVVATATAPAPPAGGAPNPAAPAPAAAQAIAPPVQHFTCLVCGKNLSSQAKLLDHMRKHNEAEKFDCLVEECDIKFTTKSALKTHMKVKHPQAPQPGTSREADTDALACSFCGALLPNASKLALHEQKHHDSPRCDECGKVRSVRSDKHRGSKACVRPTKCDTCSLYFREGDFEKHQKKTCGSTAANLLACAASQNQLNEELNAERARARARVAAEDLNVDPDEEDNDPEPPQKKKKTEKKKKK